MEPTILRFEAGRFAALGREGFIGLVWRPDPGTASLMGGYAPHQITSTQSAKPYRWGLAPIRAAAMSFGT